MACARRSSIAPWSSSGEGEWASVSQPKRMDTSPLYTMRDGRDAVRPGGLLLQVVGRLVDVLAGPLDRALADHRLLAERPVHALARLLHGPLLAARDQRQPYRHRHRDDHSAQLLHDEPSLGHRAPVK